MLPSSSSPATMILTTLGHACSAVTNARGQFIVSSAGGQDQSKSSGYQVSKLLQAEVTAFHVMSSRDLPFAQSHQNIPEQLTAKSTPEVLELYSSRRTQHLGRSDLRPQPRSALRATGVEMADAESLQGLGLGCGSLGDWLRQDLVQALGKAFGVSRCN